MKMRQRSWLYKWLGIGIGVLLLTAASYSQDSEGKFFLKVFSKSCVSSTPVSEQLNIDDDVCFPKLISSVS